MSITIGGGSGPIQIAHYHCTGDEASLVDCPVASFALIDLRCSSHDQDAGVVCIPGKYIVHYVATCMLKLDYTRIISNVSFEASALHVLNEYSNLHVQL